MRILYLTANPQWVSVEPPPPPADQTLKVGVTADAPKGPPKKSFREYAKLQLWEELRGVTDVLFDSRAEGRVNLEVVPEVRRSDVVRYIGTRRPDVLHFSGHGEKGEIVLNDKWDQGDGEMVSEQWLEGVLADKGIDVVVLNCCWSATVAEKLKETVPLAIGTTKPVGSDVAAEFSTTFYDALQSGATLRKAFDAATKKFGDLYKAFARSDDIWNRALFETPDASREDTPKEVPPVAETADTPEQQLLAHGRRLRQMKSQLWFGMGWDAAVIAIAAVVALSGYALLNGGLAETFCSAAARIESTWLVGPTLADMFRSLSGIDEVIEKSAQWVQWEPWTVMTTLVSIPVARFVSYFWMILGTRFADRALTVVGMLPREKIEQELETGRIDLMFKRLEEFEASGASGTSGESES